MDFGRKDIPGHRQTPSPVIRRQGCAGELSCPLLLRPWGGFRAGDARCQSSTGTCKHSKHLPFPPNPPAEPDLPVLPINHPSERSRCLGPRGDERIFSKPAELIDNQGLEVQKGFLTEASAFALIESRPATRPAGRPARCGLPSAATRGSSLPFLHEKLTHGLYNCPCGVVARLCRLPRSERRGQGKAPEDQECLLSPIRP